MPKKISIFLILIISFGLLVFNLFKTEEVVAGAGDNVWGWAWGGFPELEGGVLKAGSGWISFNCYNEYNGIQEDHCLSSNYGVHICEDDTDPLCGAVSAPKTGKFVGYVWMGGGEDAVSNPTSTLGWVKFGEPLKIGAESYPVCPPSTCPAGSPNYAARLDTVTQRVTGWVRVCAGTVNGDCNSATRTDGWDGWILLGPIVKGAIDYGVSINTTPDPDEFEGWAWGSDVVGWISFNTDNYAGGSDYKVMTDFSFTSPNQPPYIELGSQDVSDFYCNVFAGQGRVDFQWTYRDDDLDLQTQFDFRVNNVNNVNDATPEIDRSFSGLNNPDGTPNFQVALVGSEINFGTPYYWWAKVYDNQGNDSGWVAGPSFTTDAHAYPYPDFTHTPQNPPVGQIVTFIDESKCYSSPGNIEYNCKDGGASIQYAWDFDYVVPTFNGVIFPPGNATTTFSESRDYEIRLKITDFTLPGPDNYCIGEGDSPVGTTRPLPNWIEVPPF